MVGSGPAGGAQVRTCSFWTAPSAARSSPRLVRITPRHADAPLHARRFTAPSTGAPSPNGWPPRAASIQTAHWTAINSSKIDIYSAVLGCSGRDAALTARRLVSRAAKTTRGGPFFIGDRPEQTTDCSDG